MIGLAVLAGFAAVMGSAIRVGNGPGRLAVLAGCAAMMVSVISAGNSLHIHVVPDGYVEPMAGAIVRESDRCTLAALGASEGRMANAIRTKVAASAHAAVAEFAEQMGSAIRINNNLVRELARSPIHEFEANPTALPHGEDDVLLYAGEGAFPAVRQIVKKLVLQ